MNKHTRYPLKTAFLAIIIAISGCTLSQADNTLHCSWYSSDSLKREGTFKTSKGIMANGKQFNENALTCACRLYPLGAVLRISYKDKSVVVRVTDRIGKRFAKTRVDLSKFAFSRLANLNIGVIPVRVERI